MLASSGDEPTSLGGSKRLVVLTMLAPATSCNQRCPCCYLTEVRREPVRSFALTPDDFAQVFNELVQDEAKDVKTVSFQGFEVTLPQSWPYVEAVFAEALKAEVRRCMITNGMRLHALIDQILALDVSMIAVSLDGADAATHDRHRGLPGALARTLKSLDIFLNAAPEMRDRIMVASVLYEQSNFDSLLGIPALLAERGVKNWAVGLEVIAVEGDIQLANNPHHVIDRLEALERAAAAHDVTFYVGDEFHLIDAFNINREFVLSLPDSVEFIRLLPSGHVYRGRRAMQMQARPDDPCWRPHYQGFVSFLDGCRDRSEASSLEKRRVP